MLCVASSAQPFTRDTSFKVTYNFHRSWAGVLTQVVEVESKGIYIAGHWKDQELFGPPRCIDRLLPNGEIDNSFPYYPYYSTGIQNLKYLNDTILYNSFYTLHQITSEGVYDWEFHENANWDTINSYGFRDFQILSDMSFLVIGDLMVKKEQPPNEYYDVGKIYRNGKVDTTFVHKTHGPLRCLLKYDEQRVLLEGNFNSYDSTENIGDGMCRIFNDGSLDTSFHSPFWFSTGYYGYKRPLHVDPDGKILVGGFFLIKGDSKIYNIARLMPNGDLDSTFNYKAELVTGDSSHSVGAIYSICPSGDNRYVVGGFFQKYEGYKRGSIVLLDYNGNVDTTAFTGGGADTIINAHSTDFTCIIKIIPAKDDKFYAVGRFSRYDGLDGAPIVRILGASHVQVEGIEQIERSNLLIHPNPVINNRFRIEIPELSITQSINLRIYNTSGKLVFEIQDSYSKHKQFHCPQLSAGVYIVNVECDENMYRSKVVLTN